MLYWATRPDPAFTAILDAMFEEAFDTYFYLAEPEDLLQENPTLGKVFTLDLARKETEKVRDAHRSPRVFRFGDYHALLLHHLLLRFCQIYNDLDAEAELIDCQGTKIRSIGFEWIEHRFFSDLDFTIPSEEQDALGLEGRKQIGLTSQSYNIAAGHAPHPEELELKEEPAPDWPEDNLVDDDPMFRPGCETYPADVPEH